MLEKYNRYKILKVFLFNPIKEFGLRELSRISGISPPSVLSYLKEFENKGLVNSIKKRGNPLYKGEIDNEQFRKYQKLSVLFEIHNSGLTDFLWEVISPKTIILYGSYAKGEALEESDIDIFIIGKEKKVDLGKFEKNIGKRIHLMFEKNPDKISKELKNNLINGVVLKGYLKLF